MPPQIPQNDPNDSPTLDQLLSSLDYFEQQHDENIETTFQASLKSSTLSRLPESNISFYSPTSATNIKSSAKTKQTLLELGLTPDPSPHTDRDHTISPTHILHEVVRLSLLNIPQSTIARILGVSTSVVNRHLNSRVGIELRAELEHAADVESVSMQKVIKSYAQRAIGILYESMVAPDSTHAERIRASTAILDRAGYVPPNVSFLNVQRNGLSADDILQLNEHTKKAMENAISNSGKSCAELPNIPESENK